MNEKNEIKQQVIELLAEQFQIPAADVTDELQFGDIPQWDSLGHMAVIAALEDKFHIEVDADLIAGLTSVKAICDHLEGNSHG